MFCPTCGKEVPEDANFCQYCGAGLVSESKVSQAPPTSPEDVVKNVLIRRIEGIKNRDAKTIEEIVLKEKYSKFDDWPPFDLQGSDALKNEADALNALKEYNYETRAWRIEIFGDSAIVAFLINYQGKIRDLSFSIRSRITAYLVRQGEEWKLVHEHWSRFLEPQPDSSFRRGWRRSPF
jgi:ketosteroid isomerase-like protein